MPEAAPLEPPFRKPELLPAAKNKAVFIVPSGQILNGLAKL
jgi:hypothetical protein